MYAFMPYHTESSSSSALLKSFKLANSWLHVCMLSLSVVSDSLQLYGL